MSLIGEKEGFEGEAENTFEKCSESVLKWKTKH